MSAPAITCETPTNGVALDLGALKKKYTEEKEKRLRPDGSAQYTEIESDARLGRLAQDPWANHEELNAQPANLAHGDEVQVVVLGAGFGGLMSAIRLVQAGLSPAGIRIVDTAGGFGGTWYWNRYPGLMCDVESYIYMPLLEETGYVPKHKYAYGHELLAHANRMAETWGLAGQGVFRSCIKSCRWGEDTRRWEVVIEQDRGPDEAPVTMTVQSQFVVLGTGVLNHPKVPKNLYAFEGEMFHSARWNYGVTGGGPGDLENPQLAGLAGRRVGIIGTGATAVQLVPQLARWAKELYVFQRTPSSVDHRGQRPTDPGEWNKIASGKGWQKRRMENFDVYISGREAEEDLVADGWTGLRTFKAVMATPQEKPLGAADIGGHIDGLLALDAARSERIRRRVDEVVKDRTTAAALKAWYPAWCKRPAFHDDYLAAFNLPNVHLVDTAGKGVDGATRDSLVAGGADYPLDVLVLSTGFREPSANMGEPSGCANMTVRGRGGVLLSDKWRSRGPATLHGILTNGFPNLLLNGPLQIGRSSNYTSVLDALSQHCAYLVAQAMARAGGGSDKVVLEATVEAEEAYSELHSQYAAWFSATAVCTPGYMNKEGYVAPPEEKTKMARGTSFPHGMNAYTRFLEDWRAEGSMKGVEVTV